MPSCTDACGACSDCSACACAYDPYKRPDRLSNAERESYENTIASLKQQLAQEKYLTAQLKEMLGLDDKSPER